MTGRRRDVTIVGGEGATVEIRGERPCWGFDDESAQTRADGVGIHPVFVAENEGLGVASSSLIATARAMKNTEVAPEVVARRLGDWWRTPEATIFRGVRRLAPNECVTVDRKGTCRIDKVEFDDPKVRAFSDPVTSIRATLEREIDGLCSTCEEIDVGLSGGVDSSTLAGLLARRGARLRVWMMDDGHQCDEEAGYAEEIVERFGLTTRRVVVEPSRLPDAFEEAVRYMEGPVINARAVAKVVFFQQIAEEGVEVFVSGVGADDLFAGTPDAFRLNAAGQPGFVASGVPIRALGRSILRPDHEVASDSRCPRMDFWGLRQLRIKCVTRHLVLPMEVASAASMGIRVVTPFLSPAILEVARDVDREASITGDYGKVALRRAVQPWIGEQMAWQRKVPVFAPAGGGSEKLRRRWADLFARLVTRRRLERVDSVCPEAAKALVDEYHRLDLSSEKLREVEQVLMHLASMVVLVDLARR